MMDVDEKAMAYCLIEALFAAGLLNLPTDRFCSLKALVPLCIRTHMEICRIDDRSGCGKG